ncbi:hypothetical protein [Streptomyces hundungensis]
MIMGLAGVLGDWAGIVKPDDPQVSAGEQEQLADLVEDSQEAIKEQPAE